MRPDLYPSAKDAPVFTDVDKTILAETGIYYFLFKGSGKAGLRIVFKDINGDPILTDNPMVCGGGPSTPIPTPSPTPTPVRTPTPTPTRTPTPVPTRTPTPRPTRTPEPLGQPVLLQGSRIIKYEFPFVDL